MEQSGSRLTVEESVWVYHNMYLLVADHDHVVYPTAYIPVTSLHTLLTRLTVLASSHQATTIVI